MFNVREAEYVTSLRGCCVRVDGLTNAPNDPAVTMTASAQESAPPLGPFGWTMGFIGTLASASAAISLVQHWGDIELATLPGLYVGYYRVLLRSLVDWFPLPFHWRIPQWYLDALAVNGVVAGAASRAAGTVKYPQLRLFAMLLSASTLLLLAWLAGPWLVGSVSRFAQSNLDEAQARLAQWIPERERLRKSHPGGTFPQIDKEIHESQLTVARYSQFLAIRKRFVVGIVLVVLATGVFFALNGMATNTK